MSVGANAFAAPSDATLAADTTYVVRVKYSGGLDDFEVGQISSDAVDSGGAAGWSITSGALFILVAFDEWEIADTVSIRVNGDAAPLQDAAGDAAAEFTDEAVTNETPAPANTAPTGLPVISGTARVGETLTAVMDAIADGLDDATFAYQWLANDGTDDTGIEDATAATYTLTAAEAGKTIRVRVTFTDDGGTEETLVSAATAGIARALTASFPPSPYASTRHTGPNDLPQVVIEFSETVASFTASTPSIRIERGTLLRISSYPQPDFPNRRVLIVQPVSSEDVTIHLDPRQGCDAGGICTPGGATLGTVPDPKTIPGLNGDGSVRAMMREQVFDVYGSAYPWLREMEQAIQRDGIFVDSQQTAGGVYRSTCDTRDSATGLKLCRAYAIEIGPGSDGSEAPIPGDVVHELSHAYTLATRTPSSPRGVAAAHLYLNQTPEGQRGRPRCESLELLADLATLDVMDDEHIAGPWRTCHGTYDDPGTRHASEVVRAALRGQEPTWFGEHYPQAQTSSEVRRTLWHDVLAMESISQRVLAAWAFRHDYEGYCDTERVNAQIDAGTNSAPLDPWRVGGCVPAPPRIVSAVVDAEGQLSIVVQKPESAGAAPIARYALEWRTDGQQFETERRAVHEGATPPTEHWTIATTGNSLPVEVRVRAQNALGPGAWTTEATATARDRVTPVLSSAAVDAAALTLTFSEALDADSKPSADAFAVTVAGTARTVAEVALSGSAVELTLASAVASGETVTVGYTAPAGADAAPLQDAAGNAVAGFSGGAVANETPVPANTAPTGLPVISGTARVGETLTAVMDAIADADGLDNATFAYQWFSSDGTEETAIADATAATYTVAAADVGKTLKVRVSFTDDGGTQETLTSAATAAVPVRLTAQFEGVPEAHDGAAPFTFELRFSEEVALGFRTVRDSVLEVSGGRVTRARRLARPSNIRWEITVSPASDGAVTVVLPTGRACATSGAVCTKEGSRALSEGRTALVPGPRPRLSIEAGTSPVREGAEAVFTLARTGDASAALTVTVEVTESGAMLSGATPTEVTFEAESATAALALATADDEAVEDASAVAVTVAAGDGHMVAADAASATVTVEDDDTAPEVVTASALAVAENATAVATLVATDADTDLGSLAWSIAGGADAGAFALTGAGALSFQAAKDFEAPDDTDADGSYEVTVRVTDGANPVDVALTVSLTDVDEVAPVLTGAAVNGSTLTITFSEALNQGSAPPAGAFAVTVARTARTVAEVALSGNAVTLTLGSAVASGETVTVGYTAPTGADAALLKDAAGNAAAGFTSEAVTNGTPAQNTTPTGLPVITGPPRVGEVLTASTDGITDADGLDNVAFAYQWLANDGTQDTEIEGATGATHEVAPTEVGKTLKVRVTFTDGGGTQETLTSAATEAVEALPVEVSIAAAVTPVTEGRDAVFRLRRTGDAAAELTVAVRVGQAGAVLDGAAPAQASFAAGASTATLRVTTADDETAEAAGRVSASVAAGTGYVVADGAGSAGVDVLDNDRAAARVTVLWSADMTVVDYGTGAIGAGSAYLLTNIGGSEDLGARSLWYYAPARKLRLAFTENIPEGDELTLHLGSRALALPEDSSGNGSVTWDGVDIDWSDGETIAVRLTMGAHGEDTAAGPGLSVADARVHEAEGAVLSFRVTLDAAQASAVSVRYATANGTAVAGADYVGASGAVRFAPGETAKTVAVRVLEDAHDEGEETLTLTLSAPFGAQLSDAQAVGTIVNTDPVPKAWLARFGRTVAGHVVDAIGERLEGSPGGGSHVTLGGQRLILDGDVGAGPEGTGRRGTGEGDAAARDGLAALADRIGGGADGGAWTRREEIGSGDGWMRERGEDGTRIMTGRELLLGSSFQLALEGGADGAGAADTRWTAWGRASSSRFDGEADGLGVDGEVTTFTLGADAAWTRWLAGVAVSLSEGEGGFRDRPEGDHESRGTGELESTLTSVHPYARLAVNERLSVWGTLGYGTGELTLDVEGTERWATDTAMEMAAAGARGVLVPAPEAGGLELSARTDAQLVRMTSEAAHGSDGGNLAATQADTSRLRVMLEGSRAFALEGGGALTPSLEAGLRHDGGDAETGTGIEIGGGLSYTDPATGLTVDAKARGLVAHEDTDYAEWGASGSVRIEPNASGRGLSLTLTPTWGADAGDAERLWSFEGARGLAANDAFEAESRLETEVGYGFSVFGGRGVATPHAGWSRAGESEALRLGQRLKLGASQWRLESEFGEENRTFRAGYGYRAGDFLDLSVEASRREAANDDAPVHEVMLRVRMR